MRKPKKRILELLRVVSVCLAFGLVSIITVTPQEGNVSLIRTCHAGGGGYWSSGPQPQPSAVCDNLKSKLENESVTLTNLAKEMGINDCGIGGTMDNRLTVELCANLETNYNISKFAIKTLEAEREQNNCQESMDLAQLDCGCKEGDEIRHQVITLYEAGCSLDTEREEFICTAECGIGNVGNWECRE